MKKTGFDGYVYDLNVYYDVTDIDDIVDIHKYLKKKTTYCNKMFGFVKKVFFVGLTILSSFTSINSLSCVSMNNQECKTRPQVVNVNQDGRAFFPFSIKTSKCSGSCNNINHPHAKFVFLML